MVTLLLEFRGTLNGRWPLRGSPNLKGGVFILVLFSSVFFPPLLASWLLVFLASWLFGFLASWLLGFLASWLLGFSACWLLGFWASWLLGFWASGLFSFLLVYVAFGGFLAFRILCIPVPLRQVAFWLLRLFASLCGFGFSHPSGFLAFAPFHWFLDLASRIMSITTTLFI